MNRIMKTALVAAGLSVAVSVGVYAHGGATGVVKERMTMMENLGKTLKELTAMMRGKVTYDEDKVRELAGIMRDHGGENMTKLFPKGSMDKPTEAMPKIWDDWQRFQLLANQLADYSSALMVSAGNPRPGGTNTGMGMMPPASMMGNAMPQAGMMGTTGMMGGTGMMGSMPNAPDPKQLEKMPPDAAFMHVSQTCGACHEGFRKPKQ